MKHKHLSVLVALILLLPLVTISAAGAETLFVQSSNAQHIISIEAEHFHLNTAGAGGHYWQNTSGSNYSGSAAMTALPVDRIALDSGYAITSPVLSYQVTFVTAGTHYLWVRGLGPSTSADSLHVGLDGAEVGTGSNFNGFTPTGSLVWSGKSSGVVRTLQIATAGVHTINVWMRESGMVFDKLVLTTDAAYVPSSTGPAESLPPVATANLISLEAEHFTLNTAGLDGHSWQDTSGSNYSGSAAMNALPVDRISVDSGYAATNPMLSYQVSFASAGTHYLWVRGLGPSTSADSLHVGLDGAEVSTGSNFNGFTPTGSLVWSGKSSGVVRTLQVATAGVHMVNVWMRESGMVFDKLVLTTDAAYVPSGSGPAENVLTQSVPKAATPSISPNGGTFSNAVTVSLATTTPGAQIYYTLNGTTPSQASTLYSGPFLLSTNATVKAAAFLTGYTTSEVAVAGFVISNPQPTLNPIGNQAVAEKQLLSFTVTASDSDLTIPVLSANLNALPAGASFVDNGDGTGRFSWSPQTGDAASSPYVATFKATDAVDPLLSVQETISIAVTQTSVFQQDSTGQHLISIEAEHFHLKTPGSDGHSWQNTSGSIYSGSAAMTALPVDRTVFDSGYAATSPVLSYQVSFVTAGTHYLWIRGLGPSTSADSLHVGLDGAEVSTGSNFNGFTPTGSLVWSGKSNGVVRTLQVATAGVHTISVWMRESGMVFDKLVLTTDAAYVPGSTDPAETLPTAAAATLISIEAEHFCRNTIGPEGHSWQNTSGSNYSGSAAMTALPEDRITLDSGYAATSPVLSYQVSFVTAGTYYLWVRGLGPSTSSDSLHVGLDGAEMSTGTNFNGFLPTGSLVWSGKSNGLVCTLQVATAGVHTINVWMRESGMVFDKLVLTSDRAYVPSGTGPAESQSTQSLPTVLDENFSSDTLSNYSIISTNTQGGIGQVLYDADWDSLEFISGSNIGIKLLRNVGALSSGQFSVEFWPNTGYTPRGSFSLRLKQDANNYYELTNADVPGNGILRKVVGGTVVESLVIPDKYIQDKNYHLLIKFSPQSTKVLAFGKFYTLAANSAAIAVGTIEIEFAGQDGYIDNIRYAATLNDYYVAMGDSITLASIHDEISADGIGYEPVLTSRLAAAKGYPHTIVNKGVTGEDSAAGLLRLPSLLQGYTASRFFLIQYGTNDVLYGLVPSGFGLKSGDQGYPGSFKDNMQKIIDQVKATGKIPMLAKVPKAFGTRDYLNPTLQVFNAVIDELVNENYIGVEPPNFYCHFENNSDEMDDTLHPNGTGFISMANIWYEVLTDSYGGCSP